MKIAIFGVGAVGGYFGGRLAQADEEVIFIARGDHLKAIQEKGLRVDSEYGDFIAHPTLATDNPADVGAVDVIIVATKSWHITQAAETMRPLVGENTLIVPLLNGVEAPDELGEALGTEKVLGGFCRVQSRRESAGHIIQGGTPPFVAFGELNGETSERVMLLKAIFETAGITVQVPDSIRAAMWQKLLFISAFGGVGAVTRQPAGIMRRVSEARDLLQSAMQEVYDVAIANDIPLADSAVEKGMLLVDSLAETSTASMQRDLMNGYPSELNAQNGAVIRAGERANIPTPVNRFIYQSLIASEKIARDEI